MLLASLPDIAPLLAALTAFVLAGTVVLKMLARVLSPLADAIDRHTRATRDHTAAVRDAAKVHTKSK